MKFRLPQEDPNGYLATLIFMEHLTFQVNDHLGEMFIFKGIYLLECVFSTYISSKGSHVSISWGRHITSTIGGWKL